jgi:hypothetical protein
MRSKSRAPYRGAASRNKPLRGPTAFCEKHQRRYELYRGCGVCETERPAPGQTDAEKAAQRAHLDRVWAAIGVDAAKERTDG